MTLELEIPGLPPINSSDRLTRWTAIKLRNKWTSAVCTAVLVSAGKWPEPMKRAKITITRCSATRPDYDNLVQGGKHLIDGLRRARVILDDDHDTIGEPVYLWEYAPRSAGCVRIRVEEVGATAPRAGVEIGPRIPAPPEPIG